eukprot:1034002-Karenia_brevis.AAC.1
MREFEERERLRRDKKEGSREKERGSETDATPDPGRRAEPVIGEESRNSGGSSSSSGQNNREETKEARRRDEEDEEAKGEVTKRRRQL